MIPEWKGNPKLFEDEKFLDKCHLAYSLGLDRLQVFLMVSERMNAFGEVFLSREDEFRFETDPAERARLERIARAVLAIPRPAEPQPSEADLSRLRTAEEKRKKRATKHLPPSPK